jgi:hypothetical protein
MLSTTARLENNISMCDRISVTHPLRPANVPTSFVGQFAWAGFNSFCVEIGQSISPGLHTFPTRAPLASSGLANAGLVADFWRSYGPKTTGFTSVTDAAAFQLGIWELISDGPSRNLKSGSFQVGASASPAVARAESWLNGTGTPAPSAGGPAVSLYVLQHPTRQDQVVWEPLPNITVQVAQPSVAEDGPQKLTYTFTATGPLTRDVTVNYSVGGSATAGSDFTGLPAGASTGAITIPAGSGAPGSAAALTITPTPDTVVEPDETVMITLLPGPGYTIGSRSLTTGTIENDDYLLDLILDGLPEETAPEPNELSPGAFLPIGGGRKRLDIVVRSPGDAGTITLTVPSAADKITLWDTETDGQQVLPGQWTVGQQHATVWVESTGIPGDVQLVAMFQVGNKTATDEARLKASDLSLRLIQKSAYADSTNAADAEKIKELATIAGTTADAILKAPLEAVNPATGAVVGRMPTVRRFKADLLQYEVVNGKGGWAVSEKLKLDKVAVTSMTLNGLNPPAEVLAIFEAGWKKELAASYANVEQVAGVLGGPFLPVGSITKENQFNDILGLAVPPEITGFEIVVIQEIFVQSPGIGKVLVGKIEYRWSSAAGAPANFTLARKVLK